MNKRDFFAGVLSGISIGFMLFGPLDKSSSSYYDVLALIAIAHVWYLGHTNNLTPEKLGQIWHSLVDCPKNETASLSASANIVTNQRIFDYIEQNCRRDPNYSAKYKL